MLKRCCLLLPLALLVPLAGAAEKNEFRPRPFDWPQWQGQDRTAVSREKGLLQDWPKGGPPLAWKVADLGGGYSTPSVAAGRIFGMSYRGDDEVVWALEEATGKELWVTRIAEANRKVGYGEGSRCTPTVDGDVLYALGVSGDLVCLDVAAGKERWHKLLRKKNGDKGDTKTFDGAPGGWGYAESPLVDGDRLLVTPGGGKATVVALDKKTGETIWVSRVPGGNGGAYSSIVAADFNGKRQYIQFLSGGVVGLDTDGKFLWRYGRPSAGINCTTPVYHDGRVFAAAAYNRGGGLVQLLAEGDGVKAEEVYFERNYQNHHGGLVLVDGYLYGEGNGQLACIEFKTGKEMWRARQPGKGSVAYADGRLYYRNERGPLFLVEANPEKYVPHGQFNQPQRSHHNAWPHPVIANGKLYVRDQGLLLCYDVKQH
jgi:outer membrane protein assembly factor BamB